MARCGALRALQLLPLVLAAHEPEGSAAPGQCAQAWRGDGQCEAAPRAASGTGLLQRTAGRTRVLEPASETPPEGHAESSESLLQAGKARSRTEAQDARFLMQATFGPTRSGLQELSSMTYEEWIHKEMALPVGSHREYYRARVNPHFNAEHMTGFSARPACSKGSRWHNHVFVQADIGKSIKVVEVSGSSTWRIEVDGEWRSDVDAANTGHTCTDVAPAQWSKKGITCHQKRSKLGGLCNQQDDWNASKLCQQSCYGAGRGYDGDDCSGGWAKFTSGGFRGYLCSVEAAVDGLVAISSGAGCGSKDYMQNPAIWVADRTQRVSTPVGFDSNPQLPGVLFLAQDQGRCNLGNKPFIKSGDKFYRQDVRMALLGNTPDAPAPVGAQACAPKTFLNEQGCVLQRKSAGCLLACGSPGEVANEPARGHQLPMSTRHRKAKSLDRMFDNRFRSRLSGGSGKLITWTMKALEGQDQLRQRTAWALSQILVTGEPGYGDGYLDERWINYYDIFVRHAFGNFRSVLREVTYSPLMGSYLTFLKSMSYDRSRTYPDENYAREIMQLFTIGLVKLHANGSAVLEPNGEAAATYSNEHIMNFARVFTGFQLQPWRHNCEKKADDTASNIFDPMRMDGGSHDVYPKPDLDGGYLGDGYPLCADLPARSFLARGATFEFLGYSHSGDAFAPAASSPLRGALCVPGPDGACAFAVKVVLPAALSCDGEECRLDTLAVVKVESGFYEYVPPTCVHLFFSSGRMVADGKKFHRPKQCADPGTPTAAASCCSGCTDRVPRSWTKKGRTCANANTTYVKKGQPLMFTRLCNKHKSWRQQKYCQLTCWQHSPAWNNELAYAGDDCSAGAYVESRNCSKTYDHVRLSEAESRCASLGMAICPWETIAKCSAQDLKVWTAERCGPKVSVHDEGKISAFTRYPEQNKFQASWSDGLPAPGEHDAIVELKAVFSSTPSEHDLQQRLKIGAFPPDGGCIAPCTGSVKAYSSGGSIDVNTVFESGGRYFRNAESTVTAGGKAFRNPPAFVRPAPFTPEGGALERAALAEVESLLDHLFYHPNTPMFIGRKLIQRFASSNPSASYLEAVSSAFRTGAYGGMQFTGKYGDLAATISAVLLHPEARSQDQPTDGQLREPLLKVVHFTRAMGYSDDSQQDIVLENLQEVIGQFPYYAPTVFSFFNAEYKPPRLGMGRPESELVAPEFEVFTSPMAMGLLNGLASLIKNGLSPCDQGFGAGDGKPGCERGRLLLPEGATPNETLRQLDILLTGGRLTPRDAEVVRTVYDEASPDEKLKAAQEAILLTPEFHNFGDPSPSGTRQPKPKTTEHQPRPYKAVVMLFLAGGADTFHMLVPINCPLYNEYRNVRGGAAHAQGSVLPITSRAQKASCNCSQFGIHPAMPFLQDLYEEQKKAAFISNIGSLLEPITRSRLKGGRLCQGMYSHSHQQNAAQTLRCQDSGAAPRGVGGRIADDLGGKGFKTTSFSVSGTSTWSLGFDTSTEIIDRDRGAVRFSRLDLWEDAISNITSQRHGNVYCEEYAQTFAEAIESSENLGTVLDDVTLNTNYVANTPLSKQLHQVAKLIATRGARKAERDFFFVQLGGFDHHSGLLEKTTEKFTEIDQALSGFVQELKAQAVFNSTVLVTESDFGRTLTFNGMGTDHGWGGNHMIIGGGIQGGEIFNQFPRTFVEGNEYDAGRGRVIPEFPWESMLVPVCEWVGCDPNSVFPNLGNFNRSTHIIAKNSLFRP